MFRIDRLSVEADIANESVLLDLLFCAVVTTLAERLQRAVLESIAVAAMWGDVIHHACNDAAALREAEPAEWLLCELALASASPRGVGIPSAVRLFRHCFMSVRVSAVASTMAHRREQVAGSSPACAPACFARRAC